MKRVFTFGCSMTNFSWPTWADGLCYHLDKQGWETYNYACSGMGNEHIQHALTMADLRHNLTDDDLICIVWSSWVREDRVWKGGDFGRLGSIVNCDGTYEYFVDNYFSLENYVLKNINAIHAVNKSYKVNFQGHIIPNEEQWESDDELLNEFLTLQNKDTVFHHMEHSDLWDQTPNLNATDGHPNPGLHHRLLKHTIAPRLRITLDKSVDDWFDKWQQICINDIEPEIEKDRDYEWRSKYYPIKQSELPNTKTWYDLWNANGGGNVAEGILDMLKIYKSSINKSK